MDIVEYNKTEWRELGFYYDREDKTKEWLFQGDRKGLLKLANLFRNYGKKEKNRSQFEHDHYGPYMYFKLQTVLEEKGFDKNAIYGDLEDIIELGDIVERKVKKMNIGDNESLRSEYCPESDYDLKLILEPDGFDPVSADSWIKMKESEQGASRNPDNPVS